MKSCLFLYLQLLVGIELIEFGKATNTIVISGNPPQGTFHNGGSPSDLLGMYEEVEGGTEFVQISPDEFKGWHHIIRESVDSINWSILANDEYPDGQAQIWVQGMNDSTPVGGHILFTIEFEIIRADEMKILQFEDEHVGSSADVNSLSMSNSNPTSFGGATYIFTKQVHAFDKAQEVCYGLNRYLAIPTSNATREFVLSHVTNGSTIWTGFYRSEQNGVLKWHDGVSEFTSTHFPGISSSSGCLYLTSEGEYKISDCDVTRQFICQSDQYLFWNDRWVQSFALKKTHNASLSFCRSQHDSGKLISALEDGDLLKNPSRLFNFTLMYWTDITLNATTQKYTYSDGSLPHESLWATDEPSSGECVALHKGTLRSMSCDSELAFACQYSPSAAGTLGYKRYKDSYLWATSQMYPFNDGLKVCSGNDQTVFRVDDEYALSHVVVKSLDWNRIWLELSTPMDFWRLFDNFESHDSNISQCVMMINNLDFPYLHWSNCTEMAHVLCVSRNVHSITLPIPPTYCPSEYVAYVEGICYAYVKQRSLWDVAQHVCQRRGALAKVGDTTKYADLNMLIGMFIKMRSESSVWSGMCSTGGDQLRWASDEDFDGIVLDSFYERSQCAKINIKSPGPVEDWVVMRNYRNNQNKFVCEAGATLEEWPIGETLNEAVNASKEFLSGSYCPNDYVGFESKSGCYGLSTVETTWYAACGSNELAAFESIEDHQKLIDLIKIFRWLTLDRIWVGLLYNGSANIWVGGKTLTTGSFREGRSPEGFETLCLSIDNEGYWIAEDCNTNLPSLCYSDECYHGLPATYDGKVSVTVSGLPCQYWSLQTPQQHNYPDQPHNYCCAYDGYFAPFCLTTSTLRYESCAVRQCGVTEAIVWHSLDETYNSEWIRQDTIMTCPENSLITGCRCGNEHCFGVELEESSQQNSCVIRFRYDLNQYDVATKGKLFCRETIEDIVTRTIITFNTDVHYVMCPPLLSLVGCFAVDKSSDSVRADFGAGTSTWKNCYASSGSENSRTTAVCLETRPLFAYQAGLHGILSTGAVEFPVTYTPSYISITNNQFKSFCLWLKPAQIGTLLMMAEDGMVPVLAITETNAVNMSVFIAPDGSVVTFDTSVLLDGHWHYFCVVTGTEEANEANSLCKVLIDSKVVATSSGQSPCSLDYFSGHVIIGSSDALLPQIWYKNGTTTVARPKTAMIDNYVAVFDKQLVGIVSDIYATNSTLTLLESTDLQFSCSHNREPPLNLLSKSASANGVGTLRKLQGVTPCLNLVDRLSITLQVISEYKNGAITAIVKLSYDYSAFTHFDVDFITFLAGYGHTGTNSNKVLSSQNLIPVENPEDILLSIHDIEPGSGYTVSVFAQPITSHLPALPIATKNSLVVIPPEAAINVRSEVPHDEILLPGMEVIAWDPPLYGGVEHYTLAVFAVVDIGVTILLNQTSINSDMDREYYIERDTSPLLPGQGYRVEITTEFQGSAGPTIALNGRTQPYTANITQFQNLTTESTENTGLLMGWTIEDAEFVDFYNISVSVSNSGFTDYHEVDSLQLKYTFLELLPVTYYWISISTLAGDKFTSSNPVLVRTGFAKGLELNIKRVGTTTIFAEWEVDDKCYMYQLSIEVVESIKGSLNTAACTEASRGDPVSISVYCDRHNRLFLKWRSANLTVPAAGCVYHASLRVYHHSQPNAVAYEGISQFIMPKPLTEVKELTIAGAEQNLEITWSASDPAQLVDRYKVSVFKRLDLPPIKVRFVSNPSASIDGLEAGHLYNIKVLSIRDQQEGPEILHKAWTRKFGSQSIYEWSKWTQYQPCASTCGNSTMVLRRICVDPSGFFAPDQCEGESVEDKTVICSNLSTCPTHGGWSHWSDFAECTATCGYNGVITRNRSCNNPTPSLGGFPCAENKTVDVDVRSCPNYPCPNLGRWSAWMTPYACSKSCGNGTLVRTRRCISIQNDTTEVPTCPGLSHEEVVCNERECPIDGHWSNWMSWIPAVIPCGARNSSRTRLCNNPAPSNGGKPCGGSENAETEWRRLLGLTPCKYDWNWGKWNLFTPCSVTCGENRGTRSRTRECVWEDPEFREKFVCEEFEEQVVYCPDMTCPLDGMWGAWQPWSPCSVSCGSGVRYKIRFCDDPAPRASGLSCHGSDKDSQVVEESCEARNCPPDRYRSAPWSAPHCPRERSERSKLWWEVEHSGKSQNQSCPSPTVGTVWRKCSQNQLWMKEHLSDCVLPALRDVWEIIDSRSPNQVAFTEVTDRLLRLLSEDADGKTLQSNGDIVIIQRMLRRLLSWRPDTFENVLRNEKLDHLSQITSIVQRLFQYKYLHLWEDFDVNSLLTGIQNYFGIIDEASTNGLSNLDSQSYDVYQTSFTSEVHLMLKVVQKAHNALRYPDVDSSHLSFDKSFIEIPADVLSAHDDVNTTMFVSMVKYDDPGEMFSFLPINGLPGNEGHLSFEGRKLNSALLGAQLYINDKRANVHRLKGYVYMTFYQKRKLEDPLCVFIDLKSSAGIFNDDGCEVWRVRDDKIICRCNHLTTFALLSHDYVDDDLIAEIKKEKFKSLITTVVYFCIATLFLCIVLLFYPKDIPFAKTFISLNNILAAMCRFVTILLIIKLTPSGIICLSTLCLYSYFSTVCVTTCTIRFLDIFIKVKSSPDDGKRPNFSVVCWAHPLLAPVNVALLYILYDGEFSFSSRFLLTCEQLFGIELLSVGMSAYLVVSLFNLVMIVATCRAFYKEEIYINPEDAIRFERQIWLHGFGTLFITLSVASSIPILTTTSTAPEVPVQAVFATLSVLEVVYDLFNEIWMNIDVRRFYRRKLGFSTRVKTLSRAQSNIYD